jgi:hypothetical protein
METFPEIIALWPSAEALGADIGEPGLNVRAWKRRKAIPPEHWVALVAAADRRGIDGVTYERLAHIASRRAEAA